jgi:AAA domain
MADAPELKTRKPTGKPPWPMILLAGAEKCGKSYAAAAFSASDLIDRTFFVELGEGYADHYGEIPGARYEIVEHDGSYLSIGRCLRAATMQPRPNGKPHAIILDSATELWDLLSEEAQATANRRKGKDADGEAQITMDLWNVAKKRWRHIVDLLRQYDGPVIITARLEQVTVMAVNGTPTTAKDWKIRAEKNLPFECDAVVKMPEQGKAILAGVRSLRLRTGSGLEVSDFSVEKLLTSMGIRPGETQARSYTAPKAEQGPQQPQPDQGRPMDRSKGTRPEEDPWATAAPAATTPPPVAAAPAPEQPAAPQAETGERPKPNQRMLATVNAEIKKRVGAKDEDRFALIARIIGHAVTTTNDLTFDEAKLILVTLANEQLFHDFEVAITGAAGPDVLETVYLQVREAHGSGRLTPEQFAKLNELGEAANADFAHADQFAGVSG